MSTPSLGGDEEAGGGEGGGGERGGGEPPSVPLTTRVIGLGQRVAGGLVGGLKALKPAFLTPLSDAHKVGT